ncbi:unnamed protein product [Euphydryas editha]|uniref:Uncharacterized protein n=1 Tax=Euphydryas editha TaxID=104508 RepID=A0AAU9USZ2_EUPED|nr:unnamed protein product [Euphydryas editha]
MPTKYKAAIVREAVKAITQPKEIALAVMDKETKRSQTDDMTTISDAVKLHCLLSYLSGEARSIVSHLQITSENFAMSMDILTRQYENLRVLIHRFVDIILGVPHIHTCSDFRTIFLTPLITAQCAFNNLDLPMKDSNYVFVGIHSSTKA